MKPAKFLLLLGVYAPRQLNGGTSLATPVLSAAAGVGQLNMSWSNPGNLISQTLTYNVAGGSAINFPLGASATSATLQGLVPGTAYTVSLVQSGAAGTSQPGVVTATPLYAVPATPTGLSATAGMNQISVSWNTPAGLTAQGLTYAPQGGAAVNVPVSATASSVVIPGLSAGTSYTLSLIQTNPAGGSPAATTTVVLAAAIPATPTGLSAVAGVNQISASWNTPAGLTAQSLTYTPQGGASVNFPVSATATSATLTGLTAGTPYTLSLSQTNASGTSPAATASATPTAPAVNAPATPTNFKAVGGTNQVALSWDAAPSGATVVLKRGGVALTVPAGQSAYTDTGLTAGTSYSYALTFSNTGGTSPAATATAATAAAANAPATPTNFAAQATGNRTALTWDPLPSDTQPVLNINGVTKALAAGTTSYADTAVAPAFVKSYSLSAKNSGGSSSATPLAYASPSVTPAAWWNGDYASRQLSDVANPLSSAAYDKLITLPIPAGANTDQIRIVEHDATGGVDRVYDWRYATSVSVNRFSTLPFSVLNGALQVKTLGYWAPGETRTFGVYYDNPNSAPNPIPHIAQDTTLNNGSQIAFKRVGPDTEAMPLAIRVALPLTGVSSNGSRVIVGRVDGATEWAKLPTWIIGGTRYGFTASDAPVITQRNAEVLVTQNLSLPARAGSTPDWTGILETRIRHEIRGSALSDGTLPNSVLKPVETAMCKLTMTCQTAHTLSANVPMELGGIFAPANTNNNAVGAWFRDGSNGALTTGYPNGATITAPALKTVMGASGSANCDALTFRSVSFSGFNTAPALGAWTIGSSNTQATLNTTNFTSSTNSIPVGAQIVIEFDLLMSAQNGINGNMLPAEMLEIVDQLRADFGPNTVTRAVESQPQGIAPYAIRASDNAVKGALNLLQNAKARTSTYDWNMAYGYNVKTGAVTNANDDDGSYGVSHLLHGAVLRYLRIKNSGNTQAIQDTVNLINACINYHLQLEALAVSRYGSDFNGTFPFWANCGGTITKTELPREAGLQAETVTYQQGDPRKIASIDQTHMGLHSLYAYLYLLRNEPSSLFPQQSDTLAFLRRVVTYEARRFPASNLLAGNLLFLVTNGAEGTQTKDGITDTQSNSAAGTAMASPYYQAQYLAWQVNNTDGGAIQGSSNLIIDDTFRGILAPNSTNNGMLTYLQGGATEMLTTDISRAPVTYTSAMATYGTPGSGKYLKGWMAAAAAPGNKLRVDANNNNAHYVEIGDSGARDVLNGRMWQRTIVLAMATLFSPNMTAHLDENGNSISVATALNDAVRLGATFLAEPTTGAARYSAQGHLGRSISFNSQVIDSAFTGYALMASELALLTVAHTSSLVMPENYYRFPGAPLTVTVGS